jgi:hypothetical protein
MIDLRRMALLLYSPSVSIYLVACRKTNTVCILVHVWEDTTCTHLAGNLAECGQLSLKTGVRGQGTLCQRGGQREARRGVGVVKWRMV